MDSESADPATNFRQRTRTPSSPGPDIDPQLLSESELRNDEWRTDDEDLNPELENVPAGLGIAQNSTYRSSMAFGRSVKRAKHSMSARSIADFDSFLNVCLCLPGSLTASLIGFQASDLNGHMILLMATVLEVRDVLDAQKVVDEWKIPSQLRVRTSCPPQQFMIIY